MYSSVCYESFHLQLWLFLFWTVKSRYNNRFRVSSTIISTPVAVSNALMFLPSFLARFAFELISRLIWSTLTVVFPTEWSKAVLLYRLNYYILRYSVAFQLRLFTDFPVSSDCLKLFVSLKIFKENFLPSSSLIPKFWSLTFLLIEYIHCIVVQSFLALTVFVSASSVFLFKFLFPDLMLLPRFLIPDFVFSIISFSFFILFHLLIFLFPFSLFLRQISASSCKTLSLLPKKFFLLQILWSFFSICKYLFALLSASATVSPDLVSASLRSFFVNAIHSVNLFVLFFWIQMPSEKKSKRHNATRTGRRIYNSKIHFIIPSVESVILFLFFSILLIKIFLLNFICLFSKIFIFFFNKKLLQTF